MAWEFEERFETGPDTATITTSNTDFTGVTGTHVFSSAQVAHGSLAASMDTSTTTRFEAEAPSALTQVFARFYMRIPANPSATNEFLRITEAGGTNIGLQLRMTTAGLVQARSLGASQTVTMSVATATGQWVRIEAMLVAGATGTGQMEIRLYNSPDSTTATDTISHATWDGVASPQRVELRSLVGVASQFYDEAKNSDADWVGPFSTGDSLLRVAGSVATGSLVDSV